MTYSLKATMLLGLILLLHFLTSVEMSSQTVHNIQFDCDGTMTNISQNCMLEGDQILISVDGGCPRIKNMLIQFKGGLETTKANLTGLKYYEWEPMFRLYGFNPSAEIDRLNNWISFLDNVLKRSVLNPPRTIGYSFDAFIPMEGLFYVECVQGGVASTIPLTYNYTSGLFTGNISLRAGEARLSLYLWDLEKKMMNAAYQSLATSSSGLESSFYSNFLDNKEQLNNTKKSYEAADAAVLTNSWNYINGIIEDSALRGNNDKLSQLLWLSHGKPTINVLRASAYDEDYDHSTEDSIAYFGFIDSLNLAFRDKCYCDVVKAEVKDTTKHPYRPSAQEMARNRMNWTRLKREKHEYDEHEKEEKMKKMPNRNYWLNEVKFHVGKTGDIVWMRHHDYQQKLGISSPIHEIKSEYLENQGIAILSHNTPDSAIVTMHEEVSEVQEKTVLEEETSDPIATIVGILSSSAIDRIFLSPPPPITSDNYTEIRKKIMYSFQCLERELSFDYHAPVQFPFDETSRYRTISSFPQVSYTAPVKVAYSLNAHVQDRTVFSSSKYEYRRNKLRLITPLVLIGGSQVSKLSYSISENREVSVARSLGVFYSIGLNVHFSKMNNRNPHLTFSRKGKSHDRQQNFNLSRMGLFAGVSISDPLHDFYIGPTLTIVPGLGLSAGTNMYVQGISRLNDNKLEVYDYKTKIGCYLSLTISPSVFLQIWPAGVKKLPFWTRTERGPGGTGRKTKKIPSQHEN